MAASRNDLRYGRQRGGYVGDRRRDIGPLNYQFERAMHFREPDHREYGRHHSAQDFVQYDHGFFSFNKKILLDNVYRLLIRERNVKVVLGPQGKHIKELKSKCKDDCKITIYTQAANGEPFPEGAVDRVICIESSPEDLESCLTDMIPHFQTFPPAKMMGKFNEIRLLVPDFTCSTIIGPKGNNVKNIQRDLRSFVQVHKNPAPSSTEHVVSLTNREVGALAKSAIQIFNSIQKIKGISHVTLYNPLVWYPGEFGDTGSFVEGPILTKLRGRNHGLEGFDPEYLSESRYNNGSDYRNGAEPRNAQISHQDARSNGRRVPEMRLDSGRRGPETRPDSGRRGPETKHDSWRRGTDIKPDKGRRGTEPQPDSEQRDYRNSYRHDQEDRYEDEDDECPSCGHPPAEESPILPRRPRSSDYSSRSRSHAPPRQRGFTHNPRNGRGFHQ